MDRQLALLAAALCLVAAHGCKRSERRKAMERDFHAQPTVEVSADADRANVSELQDAVEPPEPSTAAEDTQPSRASSRWMSPERWLAMQAAAAWSGKRDRPRPATPPPAASPSVEATTVADEPPSEGLEIPPEESSEPSLAVAEAATDEESADQEVAEPAEDESPTPNDDEELRRYVATVYGAGRGYTGIGAGESGYTGMGAGEGYTGIGAGPGFTGMYASIQPEVATTSNPSESAAAPTPTVVLLPVFVSPWGPYLAYY